MFVYGVGLFVVSGVGNMVGFLGEGMYFGEFFFWVGVLDYYVWVGVVFEYII